MIYIILGIRAFPRVYLYIPWQLRLLSLSEHVSLYIGSYDCVYTL